MIYNPKSQYYQQYLAKRLRKIINKDLIDLTIRKEYLTWLPFETFQTRHGTAVVLSFYGDSDLVRQLMQKLSHKSRAYFVITTSFPELEYCELLSKFD